MSAGVGARQRCNSPYPLINNYILLLFLVEPFNFTEYTFIEQCYTLNSVLEIRSRYKEREHLSLYLTLPYFSSKTGYVNTLFRDPYRILLLLFRYEKILRR